MKIRNPDAGIKYRNDIFQESAEYNVLTILEMKPEDKEKVHKQIAKLTSGDEAKKFVEEKNKKKETKEVEQSIKKNQILREFTLDWQYQIVDLLRALHGYLSGRIRAHRPRDGHRGR